jgi:acetoin utilization deacetylase AcuC-like enzyme
MGFCFFNNIAVAAAHALAAHKLSRVAVSTSTCTTATAPRTASGRPAGADGQHLPASVLPLQRHREPGANMLNVPLGRGADGEEFRHVVSDLWMPRLREFRPEMLFISAGFDAHYEDEMGGLRLLEKDYAWVTEQIKLIADESAQGRIVSMLEGGYSLSALARSVAAHLRVLAEL